MLLLEVLKVRAVEQVKPGLEFLLLEDFRLGCVRKQLPSWLVRQERHPVVDGPDEEDEDRRFSGLLKLLDLVVDANHVFGGVLNLTVGVLEEVYPDLGAVVVMNEEVKLGVF